MERRSVGVPTVSGRGQVMIPEPLHGRPGQQVAVSVLRVRFQLRAARRRRYWIDQQLKGELRPSTIPGHERHHGREQFPPALSPATATAVGSEPISAAC